MKYTYDLEDFTFQTKVDKGFGKAEDLAILFTLKGSKLSVEFSAEEFPQFLQSLFEAKKLSGEIAGKLIPLIKDSVIDLGKEATSIFKDMANSKLETCSAEKDLEKLRQANWRERHPSEK